MKCSRCQNEDVQYFFENNGRIYCRKCIAFSTKTVNLKSVKNEKKIYYHLNYSLNLEQERTSRLLIERDHERRRERIWTWQRWQSGL